jgi:hypothetical protein
MSAAIITDQPSHVASAAAEPSRSLRVVPPVKSWLAQATAASQRDDWQAEAVMAFRQSEQRDGQRLAADLAVRLLDLTGRLIDPAVVYVDRSQRLAQNRVDGVLFRLQDDQLQVIRPCIHCGVGAFASPVIRSRADLGYALSAWEPRDPDCEPFDPAEVGA